MVLSVDSLLSAILLPLSWIPCPEVSFPCSLKQKPEPLNHKGAEVLFLASFSASIAHKKAYQSGSQMPFLEKQLFLVAVGLAKVIRTEKSCLKAEGRTR